MTNTPLGIPRPPDDFVSQDDEGLFAFINTLRAAVKAKVVAERNRGVPLSEIVPQVREMVRVAEEDTNNVKAFPSHTFRAIARQAVAWCVEVYRPLGAVSPGPFEDVIDLHSKLTATGPGPVPINRFPTESPT